MPQGASSKELRPELNVLKPKVSPWEPVKFRMRLVSTSRWLIVYIFFTHSFLFFFSGTGQGGGAFESCAVTEGVVPECQSLFSFWSLLYFILYL